jgi:small GTP-binding protein
MTELMNLSKKILLLGDPAVGKTSLIRKFVYDIFDDNYISTLGAKVSRKSVYLNHPTMDKKIELKLMIWDVMGQKEYDLIHKSAYQGAQGALIVADLTRKETLDNVDNWITGLFNVTGQIPIVLLGNKNDLEEQHQFKFEDLKNTVSTFAAPVFYTSARTGENVEASFKILGESLIKVDLGT